MSEQWEVKANLPVKSVDGERRRSITSKKTRRLSLQYKTDMNMLIGREKDGLVEKIEVAKEGNKGLGEVDRDEIEAIGGDMTSWLILP